MSKGIRRATTALAWVTLIALAEGCGVSRSLQCLSQEEVAVSRAAGGAAPAAVWCGRHLAAAGDADDEDVGLLHPVVREPGEARAHEPRTWKVGIRAGLLVPHASPTTWDPGACVGGYYRGRPRGRSVLEFGLDYAAIDADNRPSSSQLLFLNGELLRGSWEADGGKVVVYVLVGGRLISEQADHTVCDTERNETGAALSVGVGAGPPTGAWDVRAAYSVVVGSDNGSGAVMVAAGAAF